MPYIPAIPHDDNWADVVWRANIWEEETWVSRMMSQLGGELQHSGHTVGTFSFIVVLLPTEEYVGLTEEKAPDISRQTTQDETSMVWEHIDKPKEDPESMLSQVFGVSPSPVVA